MWLFGFGRSRGRMLKKIWFSAEHRSRSQKFINVQHFYWEPQSSHLTVWFWTKRWPYLLGKGLHEAPFMQGSLWHKSHLAKIPGVIGPRKSKFRRLIIEEMSLSLPFLKSPTWLKSISFLSKDIAIYFKIHIWPSLHLCISWHSVLLVFPTQTKKSMSFTFMGFLGMYKTDQN